MQATCVDCSLRCLESALLPAFRHPSTAFGFPFAGARQDSTSFATQRVLIGSCLLVQSPGFRNARVSEHAHFGHAIKERPVSVMLPCGISYILPCSNRFFSLAPKSVFASGQNQGCGIKGFIPTSVIQGNLPLDMGVSLWEALFVVSQKWSFPTALARLVCPWTWPPRSW